MDPQDSPPQEHEESTKKSKKPKAAITWVQDYLSRRSHSEKELLEKLLKKEFPEDVCLEAIAFAKERKWMDQPEELAEKVYNEWDLKNKSHSWICGYLDEKGLPIFLERNSSREAEKAAYHLLKKFGKINNDNYKRASSNIASKGFSYGDFKNALEILKDDL
ncbi:MAG: hypothetical protein ACRBBP_02735 [Bdellovibrionales bacterium]